MKMTKDLFSDLCKEGLAYLYIIKCFDDLEEFYKITLLVLNLNLCYKE